MAAQIRDRRAAADDAPLDGDARRRDGETMLVFVDGPGLRLRRCRRGRRRGGAARPADGAIVSPMPGKIIAVEVRQGDAVTKGQKLLTLEAMKMEHSLAAPFDGIVAELNAAEGAQVSEGTLAGADREGGGDDGSSVIPATGGILRPTDESTACPHRGPGFAGARCSSRARPLLRAMDARRPDPAPAAPDGDRDRQSPDLGADPQSAAAPPRRDYAEATEFGRIVVNGTFTFALLVGLSVGDTTLGTLVANLGYDKVRMPKPVFIGDTLRAETEVVGAQGQQFAARGRHRHLRAPHVQPARRAGLRDGADGADAEAAGMTISRGGEGDVRRRMVEGVVLAPGPHHVASRAVPPRPGRTYEAALAPVRPRRPAGPDGEGAWRRARTR